VRLDTDHPPIPHPPAPNPLGTDRPAPDTDTELARERDHLTHARACLRAMRESAARLDPLGGNEVSAEALAIALARRVDALADSPETPLFFGRLDFADPPECFHIGRRHVRDDSGDPVVLDWRADLSRAFYRAHPGHPMGVVLRRRFGFSKGALTAYEDETFVGDQVAAGALGASRLLAEEIERPRTGPMRDIVATIQPEQDELVRAPLDTTVCVQGAPGTGKTAVGLHRAAYLLYAHRERLRRARVLIIGPNRSFLGYIAQVLPALGEIDVEQRTLPELVGHVPVRAADAPEVALLKGDPRMATVVRQALLAGVAPPTQSLVVPVGVRRWRVPVEQLQTLLAEVLAREVRYAAARSAFARQVGLAVVRLMEEAGEAPSDRATEQIARLRPVRDVVDATLPVVKPKDLVRRLLTDVGLMTTAATGVLDDDEQSALLQDAPPRPVAFRWSLADAVLVDEAVDLVDRTASYGHVVLDEAQDLSPMQCRAVGRRCSTGSATVLGDLAQGTTPEATTSWRETLTHLGKPEGLVEVLTKGYRVPAQVIDFASRLLPAIAPGVAPAVSVRRSAGSLRVVDSGPGSADEAAAGLLPGLLAREGSVGVVAADLRIPALARALRRAGIETHVLGSDDELTRLTVVPASLAKGLEFDVVVVVEPAEIVAAEPRGLRRLYVVLTRAVSELVVVHEQPLPAELVA
jgi:hypothetical protein